MGHDSLNRPQLEAVEYTEGPLLILAGAGSGKTRVLTYRTAYLIEKGVRPWNILCITFTNKAAKEMRERVDTMVDSGAEDVMVSTFHSLCLRILFRHAELLGYDSQFEICDTTDQKQVMKQVLKDLNVDTKKFKERTFLNAISSAKNELLTPEEYMKEVSGEEWYELCAQVYREYQKTLKASNSMDFDDLIMQTVKLFRSYPEVLESYQDRYRYIMVDEYQDTNTAQFELVRLLASKYNNICVVGDDDQSIYRFRGANIMNILDFEKHYPLARIIRLEQNYRSTRNILDAANAVISNNEGRKKKTLWTDGETGERLSYRQLESSAEEAMFVAEDIKKRVEGGEFRYGDCAILMRTNVQSKEFEDAFRVLGIDYDLVKGLRFWDTKVIKDLTSYLLTVVSGQNDMRTLRIINLPSRGIGPSSIEKIRSFAYLNDISVAHACRFHADRIPGLGRSASKVKAFGELIYRLRESSQSLSFSDLLDEIISATGYDDHMQSEADTPEKYKELTDYVDKLKEALDIYEEEENEPDIVDFMRRNGVEGNNIDSSPEGGVIRRELSPEEEAELREKRVLIMTMHNAKGLEFPNVYLVGMEEGIFPGFASIFSEDPDDIEEERRLCYVAITRAKSRLTLLGARHRMVNGETRYNKTSRFVKEIPLNLLEMDIPDRGFVKTGFSVDTGSGHTPGGTLRQGTAPGFAGAAARPKISAKRREAGNVYSTYAKAVKGSQIGSVQAPDYEVSDRVRHVKFGEGTVTDISKGEKDYEVTVDFDTYGIKKLFAGFAKLVKVV